MDDIKKAIEDCVILISNSNNEQEKEKAVLELGNIVVGCSNDTRELLLKCNAFQAMLCILKDPLTQISTVKNITLTLSNIYLKFDEEPSLEMFILTKPILENLIDCQDEEIIVKICSILSRISKVGRDSTDIFEIIVHSKMCKKLIEFLNHTNPKIQFQALKTIGNLFTGDDKVTQYLLKFKLLLPSLLNILKLPINKETREVCWIISNIVAENSDNIQKVIDAQIIPTLITFLSNGSDFDTKMEVVWVISNILTNGTQEQKDYLLKQGCVLSLCNLYKTEKRDHLKESLEMILETGKEEYIKIIEECGIFNKK